MRLSCRAPDGSALQFELQPTTRLGRGPDNDIQLFDSSASTDHCELRVRDGVVTAHDLGSTNGIVINGESVQEGVLPDGAILKIGETEFVLENPDAVSAAPLDSSEASAAEVCENHPGTVGDWRCSKCRALFCLQCVVDGRKFGTPRVKFCPTCSSIVADLKADRLARQRDERGGQPMDSWKYPFRGEGLILLIGGTVFLALTTVVQMFAAILSIFIFIFLTGYLLAYSQKIITTTANGEHEPPTWPDFSDFTQDILPPVFQALGLFVLYLLPAQIARWFLPEDSSLNLIVSGMLLVLALFMAPMAWLGVSMHDSIVALSPRFVIPSILRILASYVGVALQLILLVAIDSGLSWTLKQLRVPFLPWLLSSFLSLYFLMVISRLLGILYYRNRAKLGWF
jgi:hypothetical protein